MLKQLKKRKSLDQDELFKVSLVCSVLALGSWNIISQTPAKVTITLRTIKLQPLHSLFFSIANIESNLPLQELVMDLLQTLNTTFDLTDVKLMTIGITNKRLKQYLRKFNFFYSYYYLSVYPNDISTLSRKKTNTLAIKNLFFLHNI